MRLIECVGGWNYFRRKHIPMASFASRMREWVADRVYMGISRRIPERFRRAVIDSFPPLPVGVVWRSLLRREL